MFPHGSYLIGLSESLGEEINDADLSKITREDIRRWRGRYNMAGAHGVSSDKLAQMKVRAKELGIDWDNYTPISVGMTIKESDEEVAINKVNRMIKTGDVIRDDSTVGESCIGCVNNNEKPEYEEVDGRLVKHADKCMLNNDDDDAVYDVTVTFQTVVRVTAANPENAIGKAEVMVEDALTDGDIEYQNFGYSAKK